MNIEEIREYCLAKKLVSEGFPFGDTTLVFKVSGKIFALISLDEIQMNLKCDPHLALELRERHNSVIPGYHMNKKYWNTILLNGTIPDKLLKEWIDLSYSLVAKKGKKSNKANLNNYKI
jgi:predicted DNA-binding protein (MmcQ/YjbR family)